MFSEHADMVETRLRSIWGCIEIVVKYAIGKAIPTFLIAIQ